MSPVNRQQTHQRERIRPLPSFLVLIVLTVSLWGFVYVLAKNVHPQGTRACSQQCQTSEHRRTKT